MNKKQLYESIMLCISKEVKKALNENAPFKQGKTLYILCDANDQKIIQPLFKSAENEVWDDYSIDNDCSKSIEIEKDNITLSGVSGSLSGSVEFYVSVRTFENYDDPRHTWIESEITGVTLDGYDLTLTDEDGVEYDVRLKSSDMPRIKKEDRIEDTEVRRQYVRQKEEEERQDRERRWEEDRKRKQAYEKEVKSNPEKYIKYAEELMKSAEKSYTNWSDAGEAEDIYKILGMKAEAEQAHSTAVWGYHQEEAAAGLL